MNKDLSDKYNLLKNIIHGYSKIAIAFSGGVDSTFLLKVAKDCLGENVLAVTTHLASFPARERNESLLFCKENNIRQKILEVDEFKIEGFSDNPTNRCYLCKKTLFTKMLDAAKSEGFDIVADGSNIDDEGDYRPGLLALSELSIESPLRKAGLSKSDIRSLSANLGLSTFDKPSFACLSTRIPYGETITKEKLMMIERGEQLLFDLGFKQFRVRHHGDVARIEIEPNDFEKLLQDDIRNKVISGFSAIGFAFTSLDLTGYKTGSLNHSVNK